MRVLLEICGFERPCSAGLFDPEKELARLAKQREKLEAELANATARLSNEKFIAKAPERVIGDFKSQRDAAKQKLLLIQEKSEQMQALI